MRNFELHAKNEMLIVEATSVRAGVVQENY